MTERAGSILRWIAGYIERHGYAPSIREVGDAFGIASTNGVRRHLGVMVKAGYLERTPAKSRAMRLTSSAKRYLAQAAIDAESTA